MKTSNQVGPSRFFAKKIYLSFLLVIFLVATATTASARGKRGGRPAPVPVYDPNSTYVSSYSSSFNYKHEIELGLSQGLIHSHKIGDSSFTEINFNGSYHYTFKDKMQLGGMGGLASYTSGNTSTSVVILMGTFTYNLDSDFKKSLFGEVGVGLYPAYKKDSGKYESAFSFFLDVGKRFPLWEHVVYRPLFRIGKFGDQDMEFLVLALNVALMF